MQQGKARSNGKGTMQRGKGWAKQQGAKGQRVKECKGVKDRLKIYYNSLIINVIHPVRVKGLYLSPYRTVQYYAHQFNVYKGG